MAGAAPAPAGSRQESSGESPGVAGAGESPGVAGARPLHHGADTPRSGADKGS